MLQKTLLTLFVAATATARLLPLPLSTAFEKQYKDDAPDGDIFALLVAGSNGFWNYRHQADVAHAYHLLLEHDVKAENIIVMMYDDVANHTENPYPGKLFNHPSMKKDVYAGLKIDYREGDVTPQNFLNLIKGNASGIVGGNGRILKSGPKDRVFIYFTDHGATGMIAFPEGMVTTKELNQALLSAAKKGRFGQLVFYLEACESGSMFERSLPSNLNIYAVTAANGTQSSWGTYCDITKPHQMPCLGDLFSVNWMEDSDEEKLATETIRHQFELVKKETSEKSSVEHFGNFSIEGEPVGWFQGMGGARRPLHGGDPIKDVELRHRTAWPSRDIELMFLTRKLQYTNDAIVARKAEKRIKEIREQRRTVKHTFKKLVDKMLTDEEGEGNHHLLRNDIFGQHNPILLPDCHNDVVYAFKKICIDFNKIDYAFKYVYVLNNLCNYMEGNADHIIRRMVDVCI